jgi:ribonuclease D
VCGALAHNRGAMEQPTAARTAPHAREISREDLSALPVRRFEGEIRLVRTADELELALADIRDERVVGFDTEKRPTFRVGEHYPPSLVQVATARAVYLFQLQRMDFSAPLATLFAAASPVKAGVSVADDLKELKLLFPFEERGVVDLGLVAKRHGLRQSGVRNLAGMFLGFRITKGAKTTNWSARELSAQQVAYAATDAWACRELYLAFETQGWL